MHPNTLRQRLRRIEEITRPRRARGRVADDRDRAEAAAARGAGGLRRRARRARGVPGARSAAGLDELGQARQHRCTSPTTPRSQKSKIGAFASLLIATIVSAPAMPTLCWIAPEMPQAMYSRGETVLPVWPTCAAYGYQPASTTARVAATSPPSALRELLAEREVLGPAEPAAAGDEHVGLGDVDADASAASWPTTRAALDHGLHASRRTRSTSAPPPLAPSRGRVRVGARHDHAAIARERAVREHRVAEARPARDEPAALGVQLDRVHDQAGVRAGRRAPPPTSEASTRAPSSTMSCGVAASTPASASTIGCGSDCAERLVVADVDRARRRGRRARPSRRRRGPGRRRRRRPARRAPRRAARPPRAGRASWRRRRRRAARRRRGCRPSDRLPLEQERHDLLGGAAVLVLDAPCRPPWPAAASARAPRCRGAALDAEIGQRERLLRLLAAPMIALSEA